MSFISDNSFFQRKVFNNISEYKDCLEAYNKDVDVEQTLDTKTPIFLDANVLLRYYELSFVTREKLYKFIEENLHRVYLSQQVQKEFIKNRERIIRNFSNGVTKTISKDFQLVLDQINSFIENREEVLKDYPFFPTAIKKTDKELNKNFEELKAKISINEAVNSDLIFKDKFLDLIIKCRTPEPFVEEDLKAVNEDYNKLIKHVEKISNDDLKKNKALLFPGVFDRGKEENNSGDFVIFMEMINFMNTQKTNVIFLTFDERKGDWLSQNNIPYKHYIDFGFKSTKQILYIFHAVETLSKKLDANVDSLVPTSHELMGELTLESLNQLIRKIPQFTEFEQIDFPESFIEELKTNGFYAASYLKFLVTTNINAALLRKEKNPTLNWMGAIRAALKENDSRYAASQQATNDAIEMREKKMKNS